MARENSRTFEIKCYFVAGGVGLLLIKSSLISKMLSIIASFCEIILSIFPRFN